MRLLTKHHEFIECSPAIAWKVTVDIERWPEWAPTINAATILADKPFGMGSAARLKQPAQPETIWWVSSFEEGRYFAWDATVHGIHMRGGHQIDPSGSGTRSTMTLHVTGLASFLLWPLIKFPIGKAVASENVSLKARCESVQDGALKCHHGE